MEVTYRELFDFAQAAQEWLKGDPPEGKLLYATSRVYKKASALCSEYQDKITDLKVKYCQEDDKGVIEKDQHNQFRYTKVNQLKQSEETRKLFESKVSIQEHIVPCDVSKLKPLTRLAFDKFVINLEEPKDDTQSNNPAD